MSDNQLRGSDNNEYKRSGRSGNPNSPRNFPGGDGGRGGGSGSSCSTTITPPSGTMAPIWDPRVEMNFPGRGVNHGVLRTPRGQPPGQYIGGILYGQMQSPGQLGIPMQRDNSDSDRWQRATNFQKGLIPSPQTPGMHKAERKYEIGKITDEEQAKQRILKGILNKMNPQNFEKLFDQVKQVNIDNAGTLSGVVGQIFEKALMKPTFVEMYATFCTWLSVELPDFSENDEKITFKRLLINKCQEAFERGEREEEEANRTEEGGEVKKTEEEREEARRRKLGNIRLIGELYKKRMLTERIMHECIRKLLSSINQTADPDEENIEALCKLMSSIGEMIDHPKAKEHMDVYFDIMFKLSNSMDFSSRVRLMLKDAIELRKNKWQHRRKYEVGKIKATGSISPSSSKVKGNSSKARKKIKDILKNADARGTTSDLYNAYKRPEEKKETSSAFENPPVNSSEKEVLPDEKRGPTKFEPDDWEDAADISTPKMETGLKHHSEDDNEGMTKKYSRDFLLKFSDHCTDLPVGFEKTPEITEIMSVSGVNMVRDSYPSPGRGGDRAMPGPRLDRRSSNVGLDISWSKGPGTMSPIWDPRVEMNFPGRGVNHGVLRTPRGQPPGQYIGGILYGQMQSPGQLGIPMQRNNSDSDRWQRASNFQKGLIPSPHTPVMHKAERKYEVGKITDEEQAKQRQLKGILNKLTPQNFEKLFDQVKQVNIDNADTLSGVIGQIFDKALMEPTFVEMYANFCSRLSVELPDFSENDEKITFKRLLLNKCQEEFERGEREEEEANRTEEEGEVKQTEEEREEKRVKARRRMLGNIRLIGELYKKRMLTERIMHECIKKLLGINQTPDPDEENIEALCKLMSTIGEMIDHPKAKEHMDVYFDIMFKLSNNMDYSSRVRFMLKDAIDLRKNKWQQRRKVEGPKKIDEVHREAAQERQAQANRLARGPSSNPSTRRAQMDFGPKGSNVLPSNPQMGGYRGVPQQFRAYGNPDPRLDTFENRPLSVPLRPMGDDTITLGPQGGLARGMSVRGQPSMQGMPLHDMDSRRGVAGPNGYGSISERAGYGQEDLASRWFPRPVYDPSNIQEHNMNYVNRDMRNAGRGFVQVPPSSPPERARVTTPLPSGPSDKVMSEERLHDKSIETIKEFYSARDEKEVALCIRDLNAPSFYPSMISIWVIDSFERKDVDRESLTKLLINLAKSRDGILSQDSLVRGFECVLSTLEDAVNDAPKAAEFLGRIFAKVLLENVIPYTEVWRLIYEGGEEQGRLVEIGLAAEVLGVILEIIKSEKGDPFLNNMRMGSDLQLKNFRPPTIKKTLRLDKFI